MKLIKFKSWFFFETIYLNTSITYIRWHDLFRIGFSLSLYNLTLELGPFCMVMGWRDRSPEWTNIGDCDDLLKQSKQRTDQQDQGDSGDKDQSQVEPVSQS